MYGVIFRQVIRRMDPEFAHRFGVWGFRRFGWAARALRGTRFFPRPDPHGAVAALGCVFPAPLGLAAGLDKDAVAIRGLLGTGFAFVEVGTITPLAQPGNERPRSWRELDLRGLRNQMGFNNAGLDAAVDRLAKLRKSRAGQAAIVGVNIGKNKATSAADAAADYGYCARLLGPYASFLVVNVSSPNTPGLRDLQAVEALGPILAATVEGARGTPVLVKISPDLSNADVDAVADLAKKAGLAGVVATNTTIQHDRGPGGLSGPPLLPRAIEVVARLRKRLGEEPVIIGVGGISTAADARALLDAGATLVEAYTALIYEGPAWPARINAELTSPAK